MARLQLTPFIQSHFMCGPASLKILLSYFGKNYTEKKLAKMSGASTEIGTLHQGLIDAAAQTGAKVIAKDKGTLNELKKYILKEKLPVLVGWFDTHVNPTCPEPTDHFSVVYHISDHYIYLLDPATHTGYRKMSLTKFLKFWYDFDVDETKKIHRWYMVIKSFSPPISHQT